MKNTKKSTPPTITQEALISVPFIFKNMDKKSAEQALRISEYTLGRYKQGEKIFDHENFQHSIAFVLNGEAHVYKSNSKRKTLLSQLQHGDSFGAASLFGETPNFPTSIYANTECDVMFISQEKMSLLITNFPQIAINYIYFLSSKIRFLNDKIDSFAATSAEEKTAKFLLNNTHENKIFSKMKI